MCIGLHYPMTRELFPQTLSVYTAKSGTHGFILDVIYDSSDHVYDYLEKIHFPVLLHHSFICSDAFDGLV